MEKNSYAYVLDLRKFVEVQTHLRHCLKILSTPVYKINSSFAIKDYICPKLRKLRRIVENNRQGWNTFFLVYLSDMKHRKNTKNPSPDLIQG